MSNYIKNMTYEVPLFNYSLILYGLETLGLCRARRTKKTESRREKKLSLKNQFFTHPITTKSKNEPNPDHTCTRKRNLNKTKIKTH